ncbi:MAG TPA: 4a-hydroxytetrahydrobiopterin dehydratase [Candidatus Saccharimonadales bacterium]|nr:4a-hydroxytetrahydrobiopterin dehydratase [Candidatus Saccharimonadales bacterium]
MKKLSALQIKSALAAVPEWDREGVTISRTYQFKDFPAAVKFVNTAAAIAEEAWHHPDIDIRWNKVTLILTTHDAGGLTEKDFTLAQKFDRAATAKS